MVEYKIVLGTSDGKTVQKVLKDEQAEALHNKIIGDSIKGDDIGLPGYEFVITGGSDKCGFPMRKGIQVARKRVMVGKSVGFSGKNRNKKKQNGLFRRKTVCGERISKIIRQVNLKVTKAGSGPLSEAPAAEEAPAE